MNDCRFLPPLHPRQRHRRRVGGGKGGGIVRKMSGKLPEYVRFSLRHIAVSLAHLWFSGNVCEVGEPQGEEKFIAWIRSRDIHWGNELLQGKCIQVTVEIVDDPPMHPEATKAGEG